MLYNTTKRDTDSDSGPGSPTSRAFLLGKAKKAKILLDFLSYMSIMYGREGRNTENGAFKASHGLRI